MTDLPYTYKDSGGSELRIGRGYCTASDRTNHKTVSVDTPTGEDAVAVARVILAAAGDTGHEVISAKEIGQIIEDSTAIGARTMRERAAAIAGEAPNHPHQWPAVAIRALPLLADDENPVDPQDKAPRDTELIQQVRALVKRYGAPWVAYEAARQARH